MPELRAELKERRRAFLAAYEGGPGGDGSIMTLESLLSLLKEVEELHYMTC